MRKNFRRRSTHDAPHYCADFETTTDPADTRVWAWCQCGVFDEGTVRFGETIDDFMIQSEMNASITWFHNLKFDGAFIVDWLLKHGYRWTSEEPRKGEFSTLISDMGQWYQIIMHSNWGVVTQFRDSLKKIPLPVASVAKAFDTGLEKLDLDYEADRPVGHVLTDHEQHYLLNDVLIMVRAMKQVLDSGMERLTIGADSLNEFMGGYGKMFRHYFPLLDIDTDNYVRRAYRGGYTYANRKHAGVIQPAGIVLDVNSLYPSVMRYRELPFGAPAPFEGAPPEDGLWIARGVFTAKLRKGGVPCIQVKNNSMFNSTEYLEEVHSVELTVTNIDLALWDDNYELTVDWIDGMTFQSHRGFFDDYIDKWMEVKANSTGGRRTIAKLHLNSLYGKFASGTNVTGKKPVLVDDQVSLVTGPAETRNPVYTPIGVFITAWARDKTIRSIMANRERFLYADTDSMHLLGTDMPDLEVHPTKLGAWAHESTFERGVYIRAKQYCEVINGKPDTHIAGLPRRLGGNIWPEDLLRNQIWHGKLVPKRTPGGVVLQETTFKFTALEK